VKKIRQIYEKPIKDVALSQLKLGQLQGLAILLSLPIFNEVTKRNFTKDELKESIKTARASVEKVDDKADEEVHVCETTKDSDKVAAILALDFDKFLQNCIELEPNNQLAHTSTKFFPASKVGSEVGDYHANFDYIMFYKIIIAFALSFPDFCRYNQKRLESGTLTVPFAGKFYDFETGKVCVAARLFIDNAKYHSGIACSLMSLNKGEIQDILIAKGVKEITFDRVEPDDSRTLITIKVPSKPETFKVGCPTKEELYIGARDALFKICPVLLEAPYTALVASYKDEWGPDGIDGLLIYFTAPYTAACNWVPCEFLWSNVKGYVAKPANQIANKTPAQVIYQLQDAFDIAHKAKNGTYNASLFRHCADEINAWIQNDIKNGGPFKGTFNDPSKPLEGWPVDANGNANITEWKKLAGIKNSNTSIEHDATTETDTTFDHGAEVHDINEGR
jgi:hypothetical protein